MVYYRALLFLGFLLAISGFSTAQSIYNWDIKKLENLDLNRRAIPLTKDGITDLKEYRRLCPKDEDVGFPEIAPVSSLPKYAEIGFQWCNNDNQRSIWRPQGISKIDDNGRNFLVVSWYGDRLGVRFTFVDLSSSNYLRYRHVLLVGKGPFGNFQKLKGDHAGGLVFKDGKIFLAGKGNTVRVLDIEKIREIPKRYRKNYGDYRYVLPVEYSKEVSQKTSFLSFDWSRNLFLTGTFDKNKKNKLLWFDDKFKAVITEKYLKYMQGAVSQNGHLWVSTSFGRHRDSTLFIRNCCDFRVREIKMPPGLEDLEMRRSENHIWTLTEFGPHERVAHGPGRFNNRIVFSLPVSSFEDSANSTDKK